MLKKDRAVDSTTTAPIIYDKEKELLASTKKDEDHELINSTKCQIYEAKEENQKLKWMLSKMMKDYKSLQMHFQGIISSQNSKNIIEEQVELVSLSLGRTTSRDFKKELYDQNECSKSKKINCKLFDGLELGLDCKFTTTPENSFDQESKKDDNNNNIPRIIPQSDQDESKKENIMNESFIQNYPPSNMDYDDEDLLQHNPQKKARVSIRAVCGSTTMNDGCQWRKYGQKIAKGNPCPRAYYRCTVSPSCPVRKQVQRCFEDMSILITTYEGTHNHPLPFSATAMASTTSAAASMLKCTSSSSSTILSQEFFPNVNQNLHGLINFTNNTSNKNLLATTHEPITNFYLPPKTSISTSQSHPTITLDFTTNSSSSSLISTQRYSSNSLKSSSNTNSSSSFNSYTTLCNNFKSQIGASSNHGRSHFH